MSEKDKKEKKALIGAILFAIIAATIGIAVWLLTNKTETYISGGNQGFNVSSLTCMASHPTNPFFISSAAQNYEHKLKLIFNNDVISGISYNFEGTYNMVAIAETAAAEMHAQYNKYMGKYGVSAEKYNPVFSSTKTKANVSIYAESAKLNRAVAVIFFITDEEFAKINDYKAEDFKKNYESKGFHCNYNE